MNKFLCILCVILVIFSLFIIPVSADTYINVPEEYKLYNYVVKYSDTKLLLSDDPIKVYWVNSYNGYFAYVKDYVLLEYVDNNNYTIIHSRSDATTYNLMSGITYKMSNIDYSNHDIYTNENVFFSKATVPLYILQNKTLLQPLHQSVIQNSQILLACGVGILSLILLVGLSRKLYLYL